MCLQHNFWSKGADRPLIYALRQKLPNFNFRRPFGIEIIT